MNEINIPGPQQHIETQKSKIISCYSNVKDCLPQPIVKKQENAPLEKAEKSKPIIEPTAAGKQWAGINKILADIDAMVKRVQARRK